MSGGPAAHAVVLVEWAEEADTALSGFDDTEVLVRVVGGEDESELAMKCGPGDSQDEARPSNEFEMLDNMLACHNSGQSCSADRVSTPRGVPYSDCHCEVWRMMGRPLDCSEGEDTEFVAPAMLDSEGRGRFPDCAVAEAVLPFSR
jgi:hypothetical protein